MVKLSRAILHVPNDEGLSETFGVQNLSGVNIDVDGQHFAKVVDLTFVGYLVKPFLLLKGFMGFKQSRIGRQYTHRIIHLFIYSTQRTKERGVQV